MNVENTKDGEQIAEKIDELEAEREAREKRERREATKYGGMLEDDE